MIAMYFSFGDSAHNRISTYDFPSTDEFFNNHIQIEVCSTFNSGSSQLSCIVRKLKIIYGYIPKYTNDYYELRAMETGSTRNTNPRN